MSLKFDLESRRRWCGIGTDVHTDSQTDWGNTAIVMEKKWETYLLSFSLKKSFEHAVDTYHLSKFTQLDRTSQWLKLKKFLFRLITVISLAKILDQPTRANIKSGPHFLCKRFKHTWLKLITFLRCETKPRNRVILRFSAGQTLPQPILKVNCLNILTEWKPLKFCNPDKGDDFQWQETRILSPLTAGGI